jgi:hypothetical protein
MATRIKKVWLCVFMAFLFSAANANADYLMLTPNTPVLQLGIQGSKAYFNFTGFTSTCAYNLIYFDATTAAGKNMYATLLAAQLSNKNLARVDYNNDSGYCTLAIVELRN